MFQLVAEAIRRAVSSCRSPTRSSKISKAEATESTRDATTDNAPVIHAAGGAEEEFKAVLLERFGEPSQAFDGLKGKENTVGTKEWKAAHRLLSQESLALKFKDLLSLKYNLVGWFDGA